MTTSITYITISNIFVAILYPVKLYTPMRFLYIFYILLDWEGFAMWLFFFFFKDTIPTTVVQDRTYDLGWRT